MPWKSAFVCALAVLAGCTGLEPAVIGTAASATQAGAAVFSKGRISAAAIADDEEIKEGVRKAASDLSLEFVFVREDDIWSKFIMKDDLNKRLTVRVRRRSETMTQVDIDVGRFGNEAIGRLFLLRLSANVPQTGLENLVGDSNNSITTDPDDGF